MFRGVRAQSPNSNLINLRGGEQCLKFNEIAFIFIFFLIQISTSNQKLKLDITVEFIFAKHLFLKTTANQPNKSFHM